jgi:hypothetical protein
MQTNTCAMILFHHSDRRNIQRVMLATAVICFTLEILLLWLAIFREMFFRALSSFVTLLFVLRLFFCVL